MAARSEASAVKHVQLEVSMKHHTHAAGGIWPMSRCQVPETGAPPFPARTVWQHVAQHSTQGPQREKGQLALWPPGEGSAPEAGTALSPASPPPRGLILGKRVATTSVALAGHSGQPDSPRSGVPRQRGEPGPTRRAKTHCKGIEGPMVSSRGGMRRPVTAQGPANLVSYRIASIHLP